MTWQRMRNGRATVTWQRDGLAAVSQDTMQPEQLALQLCSDLTEGQADGQSSAATAVAAKMRDSTTWQHQTFPCTVRSKHHDTHSPSPDLPCTASLNASIAVDEVATQGTTKSNKASDLFDMRSSLMLFHT